MYKVSLNGGERLPLTSQVTWVKKYIAHISSMIHVLFGNHITDKQLYAWCQEVSQLCWNEFLLHQDIYKNEPNASRFVYTLKDKILDFLKKKWDTKDYQFIPNFLGISGIPASALEKREDIRLIHNLNPDKRYSVEHMTLNFPISEKNFATLHKSLTPVTKNFKQNRLTELHNALDYYTLGDKLIIYNPGNSEIYYDMIAVIKETSFSDEAMIDPLQVRKIVWVCEPFPESKNKIFTKMHAVEKDETWWKVIPLLNTK